MFRVVVYNVLESNVNTSKFKSFQLWVISRVTDVGETCLVSEGTHHPPLVFALFAEPQTHLCL